MSTSPQPSSSLLAALFLPGLPRGSWLPVHGHSGTSQCCCGSDHPKPLGHPEQWGTATQAAQDVTISPPLTVIRSSKFHYCAWSLMASKNTSKFNLPFLSPKSHFPRLELCTRPPENMPTMLLGKGEPGQRYLHSAFPSSAAPSTEVLA